MRQKGQGRAWRIHNEGILYYFENEFSLSKGWSFLFKGRGFGSGGEVGGSREKGGFKRTDV